MNTFLHSCNYHKLHSLSNKSLLPSLSSSLSSYLSQKQWLNCDQPSNKWKSSLHMNALSSSSRWMTTSTSKPTPAPTPDISVNSGTSTSSNDDKAHAAVDLFAGRTMSAETELLKEIKSRITTKGPISISEYMGLALGHPKYGYYKSRENIFGTKGDFTTSPEISQLFGEMVAVWLISMWMRLGEPDTFRLIEIGPGRGVLMSDILRSAKRFPKFYKAISKVYMVETSEMLRGVQKTALEQKHPLSLNWVNQFSDIFQESPLIGVKNDNSSPIFVVCQELFDALPVYQFEFTPSGWREILVDVADRKNIKSEDIPHPDMEGLNHHLRFVLAYGETLPSRYFMENHQKGKDKAIPIGTRIEVPHAAQALAYDIGKRISENRGCALIIDYGTDAPVVDSSLRGIQNHKFVHPLKEPGNVDLSVDVHFHTLKEFAFLAGKEKNLKENTTVKSPIIKKKPSDLRVIGPVTQADFLQNMGIGIRVQRLMQSIPDENLELLKSVYQGYQRLVDTEVDGMGKIFKAMMITSDDSIKNGKDKKNQEPYPGFPNAPGS